MKQDVRDYPRMLGSAYGEPGPIRGRSIGKAAASIMLFLALSALFASLVLFQASSEGTSKRTLRRAVAAITEIDALLARNDDDLQQRAQAAKPGETVTLRDYPIDVELTRDEVLERSPDDLRDLILARSADTMYRDGTSALRDSGGPGRFTAAGLVDGFLGVQRRGVHRLAAVLVIVLAVGSAVAAALLVSASRGFGRLGSVSVVSLAASGLVLAAGLAARGALHVASHNEYVEGELLRIGESLVWIPIRDGVAFTLAAAMSLALASALARTADAHR